LTENDTCASPEAGRADDRSHSFDQGKWCWSCGADSGVDAEVEAPCRGRTTEQACPSCGYEFLVIESRLVTKPVGTFSLAGAQAKFAAYEWPYIVCPGCGINAPAKRAPEKAEPFVPDDDWRPSYGRCWEPTCILMAHHDGDHIPRPENADLNAQEGT
jgi:DNA-directed RNA polymerase subunit RPC12/RpoP